MNLDVIFTPAFLEEDDLGGCLCAVVDVLRATSSIITALVSGAVAVHPCLDVVEARREAAGMCQGSCLLGGEEKGLRIPGFDLGNSPLEYLATETIAGKVIFLCTTNGTGAIRTAHARCGGPIYIAALLNISAVSSAMVRKASEAHTRRIVILCSGREGRPSAEDLFCAGLMVDKVGSGLREVGIAPQLGDGASIAAGFAMRNREHSAEVLATSEHGRYLESLGFAADLEFASQMDVYNAVPLFDGERVVLTSGLP